MPEELARSPPSFPVDTTPHKAYNRCLDFESRASNSEPTTSRLSPLVCARTLGYMLIYAPVESGRIWLSEQIVKCGDDGALKQLGEFFCDHFIRVFKSAKSPTPTPSLHSSDSIYEQVQQILQGVLQVTPRDQRTAKAQALVRDNYCCPITRLCDMNAYENDPKTAAWTKSLGIKVGSTNAAHIFPASTNKGITTANGGNPKYAASVWAVMDCFAGVKITEELNGPDIHRLENVMTLESGVHDLFDSLRIWLEETDTPHMYRLGGNSVYVDRFSPTVTFSTTTGLPLPDRRYLRVHAACAKVANMSGAGEFIDRVLRDMEDIRVLAADGSSADLFDHALKFSAEMVY